MGEYDSALALALRLIKKKGRAVTLRQYSDAPVPDANKPWRVGQPTPTDLPGFAVLLDFGDMGEHYMPGTEVQVGDKLVLMPASGLAAAPQLRDVLVFGAEEPWAIVTVQTLEPGGVPVLHSMQVRR
jgi:hypothetical protein